MRRLDSSPDASVAAPRNSMLAFSIASSTAEFHICHEPPTTECIRTWHLPQPPRDSRA